MKLTRTSSKALLKIQIDKGITTQPHWNSNPEAYHRGFQILNIFRDNR